MSENTSVIGFADFNLPEKLLRSLTESGYETPTPVQQQAIPALLEGRDLLGHAPTGTGKTAAFALPFISHIDLKKSAPQMLVMTPTRELAIQVAEAVTHYSRHMNGLNVLPVYGGQEYSHQIRQLKRGAHVIVGTPGRIIDHIKRGTLKLETIHLLVLDEADEMLRMGFIEDIEWILEQLPAERQNALFSATMPKPIEQIARKHLKDPVHVAISNRSATAETISQYYWLVSGLHKMDAMTRILEVEDFDAIIVFSRTKTMTEELAEKLQARGYQAAAINGDMPQKSRENMVEKLKNGKLDILVATDVAARGLDVERISHVINYDIPYDTESYVHRIGRTGRAGRSGKAIVFVAPRERYLLRSIEKATGKKLEELSLPSTETINSKRITRFKQQITNTLATAELEFFESLLTQLEQETDTSPLKIAAALAVISTSERPLLLDEPRAAKRKEKKGRERDRDTRSFDDHADSRSASRDSDRPARGKQRHMPDKPEKGMERFRLEVGYRDNVGPSNIVGAIANEAGLESKYIGAIEISESFSLVDLPSGMPEEIFKDLGKARIRGKSLNISRFDGNLEQGADTAPSHRPKKSHKAGNKPKKRKKQS